MSGIEKIVEEIKKQSSIEAGEILKKADEDYSSYMAKQDDAIAHEVLVCESQAQKDRDLYTEKSRSGVEFKRRNAILTAKQECIDSCVKKAEEKVSNLLDNEYFDFLLKVLEANIQKEDGVMYLSEADLKRMPKDFEKSVEEMAKNLGVSLVVSDNPRVVDGGFVLVYGDIEENCSISALFESRSDNLKDIANKVLFETDKTPDAASGARV